MRRILLILLSAVLSYSIVFAEEAKRLEEVVVTATRTERTTEEVPAGVSVVTKEDIKDMRIFGVREALTGISGVQSETRHGGYDARLIIRGAGLKARFAVREIMVLLDGVPITDPDGLTRFEHVDTQLIDRIDVVKGPNSTLYGANAVGGVINIITKSPFEEIKSLKIGYGSYNTQIYNLIYGTNFGDKTYVTFSGSRRSTDSWRAWNEFSTNQGGIKIGHMFDDKSFLEANIGYTKSDFQLPGFLTKAQFESDITQRTTERWRHSGRYSEVLNTSLKFEKEIGNVKLKPLAYFQSWQHYHPVTAFINDGGANTYGADIQADIKHKIAGMKGVLTTGITGQIDEGSGDKYTYDTCMRSDGVSVSCTSITAPHSVSYTLSDSKGTHAQKSSDTTTKWGIYVQESIRASDKWIIDMGVRYDQVGFDINTDTYITYNYGTNRYSSSPETIRRDKTFDYISPRIGVVYKLSNIFNLYGNISTGFQTPQSVELSANPDLEPSKTYNYETGLKTRFDGGHSFDLSLFHATLNDEIVEIRQPDGSTTYSNAGEAKKRGVEFSGKAQVLKGLFLGGSYTYSDFKFVKFTEVIRGVNINRDGNRYPYIPMHQWSLFVNYKHPSGFKFKVDTYTWGNYFADNANSEKYQGYDFLTNVLVGYEKKNWDIVFDVNNVFDKRYAMEVIKDIELKYRPGAPMTMMGRVTYKF